MFNTGFMTIGRYRGVPLKIHWSAPLGAMFFSRFEWAPGFWVGFLVLILVHEMGHAFLVHRQGLRTSEIMVHGFGGYCRHERGTAYDQAIIAWGGVLAQVMVLLIPAWLIATFVPLPASPFIGELLSALIYTNLFLAAFNLIPFPPFDGHQAWKLPGFWKQRHQGRTRAKQRTRPSHLRVVRTETGETPEEMARRIAKEALENRTLH